MMRGQHLPGIQMSQSVSALRDLITKQLRDKWSALDYFHEKKISSSPMHYLRELKTFLNSSLLRSILYCEHIDKTGRRTEGRKGRDWIEDY